MSKGKKVTNRSGSKGKSNSSKAGKAEYAEITISETILYFITPLAVLLSAIIVSVSILGANDKLPSVGFGGASESSAKSEKDVKGAKEKNTEKAENSGPVPADDKFMTFYEYPEEDVCKEDGKPLVMLFSTEWCPHCAYIKETFDTWARQNQDKIAAYHWELSDAERKPLNDNTVTLGTIESSIPTRHKELQQKFNPRNSIPTFIFGCRYARVGNGYEQEGQAGLAKETEAFDAIVGKLTAE